MVCGRKFGELHDKDATGAAGSLPPNGKPILCVQVIGHRTPKNGLQPADHPRIGQVIDQDVPRPRRVQRARFLRQRRECRQGIGNINVKTESC